MWENSLGKIKSKKSISQKPYDRPKSILSRVKESVTGLLPQPAWLANWLHSSTENDEHHQNTEQPTTSRSSEQDQTQYCGQPVESFIFRKPGRNQNLQGLLGSTIPQHVSDNSSGSDNPSTSQEAFATNNLNNDDDSHSESTSGCSSLLPHTEFKHEVKEKLVTSMAPARQNADQPQDSSQEASVIKAGRGRKTLNLNNFSFQENMRAITEEKSPRIDETTTVSDSFFVKSGESFECSLSKRSSPQPQPSIFTSKRPRFSITSFRPAIGDARKSLLCESIVDSPFYSGRTTYGGASAYRRASLQPKVSSSPYTRKRVQARPASVSSCPTASNTTSASNVVLSSSAQRILQALEAMSTPVRDAKRIPTSSSSKTTLEDDPSFIGFGLNRRRRPIMAPPAVKLSVGTPVTLVSQQSIAKTKDTEIGFVSSTPISAQGNLGKIRSRVSAPVRESLRDTGRASAHEELVPELEAIPIPIGLSNLPTFSLLQPPVSLASSVAHTSIQSTSTSTPLQPSKHKLIEDPPLPATSARPTFTFSAPIVMVSPSAAKVATIPKPPSFNFSSPTPVKAISAKDMADKSFMKVQPAEELKTSGTVLDILGNGKKAAEIATKNVSITKPEASPAVQGFGDKFKPPENSWTCSVCCITNSQTESKCAACEAPAPAKSTSLTPSIKVQPITLPGAPLGEKGFGDKFKLASSQWECGVCMVRNSLSDDQCKSCEEPRPGAKISTKPVALSTFKFGIPQDKKLPEENKIIGDKSAPKINTATDISAPTVAKSVTDLSSVESTIAAKPKEAENSNATSTGFKFGTSVQPILDLKTTGFKFGTSLTSTENISGTGFRFGGSSDSTQKPTESKTTSSLSQSSSLQINSGVASTNNSKPSETSRLVAATLPNSGFGINSKKGEEPIDSPNTIKPESQDTAGSRISNAGTSCVSQSKMGFSFGTSLQKDDSPLILTKDDTSKEKVSSIPPTIETPSTNSVPIFNFAGSTKEPQKPAFTFAKPTDNSKDSGVSFNLPSSVDASKEESSKVSGGLFSFPPTTTSHLSSVSQQSTMPLPTALIPSTVSTTPVTTSTTLTSLSTTSNPIFSFGTSATSVASTPGANSLTLPFGNSMASIAKPEVPKASTFSFGISTPGASNSGPAALPSLPIGSVSLPSKESSAPSSHTKFPSVPASSTAGNAPVFSFGASSTPVTSTTSSTFSFGASAVASTNSTTTTSSTFSFGSANVPATTTPFTFGTSTSGSFSFGKEQPKLASAAPSFSLPPQPVIQATTSCVSASTPSIFTFGAQPANTQTSTTTTNVPFSFGAAQPLPAAGAASSTPSFGSFGATSVKTPFSFNTPSSSSTSLPNAPGFVDTANKTTSLSFGLNPSPFGSVPSNGFGGATASAPAAPAAATPFSFGSQAPSGGAPQPVFNSAPNFNFGSNSSANVSQQQPNIPSVFQFGNPSAPSVNSTFNFNAPAGFNASEPATGFPSNNFAANPFDITSGGTASNTNRKIRKAVRRR